MILADCRLGAGFIDIEAAKEILHRAGRVIPPNE